MGDTSSWLLVEEPPKDNGLPVLGGGLGDEEDMKLLDKLPKGVKRDELEEDIGDGGRVGLSLRAIWMLADIGLDWGSSMCT